MPHTLLHPAQYTYPDWIRSREARLMLEVPDPSPSIVRECCDGVASGSGGSERRRVVVAGERSF